MLTRPIEAELHPARESVHRRAKRNSFPNHSHSEKPGSLCTLGLVDYWRVWAT